MVITQQVSSDTIKVCAEQFFDHVEVSSTEVYIHFPELTITNELDLSIDIEGLLVKLNYHTDEEGNVYFDNLQGMRTQINATQFLGSYYHSHLPRSTIAFSAFCLGSNTPMVNVLKPEFNDMDIVFATLNAYVRNESVSGVPHIKMDTVIDFNRVVSNVLQGNPVKTYHVLKVTRGLLEEEAITYQYVKRGILPQVSIKSIDDEVLTRLIVESNIGTDLSEMSMLDLLRKKRPEVIQDTGGNYLLDFEDPIGYGDLTFESMLIIPTQEEFNNFSETGQAGNLQKEEMRRDIETFINKYLNL